MLLKMLPQPALEPRACKVSNHLWRKDALCCKRLVALTTCELECCQDTNVAFNSGSSHSCGFRALPVTWLPSREMPMAGVGTRMLQSVFEGSLSLIHGQPLAQLL